RPAILPVGGDELADMIRPASAVAHDLLNLVPLLAAQTLCGLCQRSDRPWQESPPSGPDCGILSLEEFLRLGRPRHQFAVEADPPRIQFSPEVRSGKGRPHPVEELCLQSRLVEAPPARAGVDDADVALGNAEPLPGGFPVLANDDDRPRPHVLLLADDLG